MGDKTKSKAKAAEPVVEEKSSVSELKSLGSTSSITIPRSSPFKKLILPLLAFGVLGTGGFFFTSTDLGRSILGNPPADEELVKEDLDPNAAVPTGEMKPELDENGMPKETPPPTETANGTAPVVPAIPVPVPVPAPPPAVKAAATPAKKAAVVKSKSKSKKSKAALTSKSKKSKVVASKSKAKNKKAVASKKSKAKKPAAQASVAPAH